MIRKERAIEPRVPSLFEQLIDYALVYGIGAILGYVYFHLSNETWHLTEYFVFAATILVIPSAAIFWWHYRKRRKNRSITQANE